MTMDKPRTIHQVDLEKITVAPRFAVVQGVKDNGEPKVRPVDDMTRSQCNAATEVSEKLTYESLDGLMDTIQYMQKTAGSDLNLWKADIDSAFRRVPLKPEHRKYAVVAFKHDGQVILAKHLACPFGSVASVHNWDRVGEFIKAVARRLLHLPVSRFVDDYFAVERAACVEHAKQVFARLTRCMLGPTAIAEKKLEHGNPLTILGVETAIGGAGVIFQPEGSKKKKWIKQIQEILEKGSITTGEASKMAGRLMWAAQSIFRRMEERCSRPFTEDVTARRWCLRSDGGWRCCSTISTR